MARRLDQGWLRVEPSVGSGNEELTYTTLEDNNGRNSRYKDSVVTGDSENSGTIRVIQEGRGLYVRFDPAGYTTPNAGNSALPITGYTNAKTLSFEVPTGGDPDGIITSIDSNGYKVSTDGGNTFGGNFIHNGAGPTDDPGSVQEWWFKINVNVASTSGTSQSVARLRVTASDDNGSVHTELTGNNPDATIIRDGATAFTQVGIDSNGPFSSYCEINIGWQETDTQTAQVHSNEDWTVVINA